MSMACGRMICLAGCATFAAAALPSNPIRPQWSAGFVEVSREPGSAAAFASQGPGYTLLLQRDEAVLRSSAEFRLRWVNGNPRAGIEGASPLSGSVSYFLGNDPGRWRTGLRRYGEVRYREVYPGIDLVFHTRTGPLEYDWVVSPGADPGRIRLEFPGASQIKLDRDGGLVIRKNGAELRQRPPVMRQAGKRIEGAYVLEAGRRVSFRVGAYNRREPLVIDPTLVFSTLLGGSANDAVFGIAVDRAGNAYIAGLTHSPEFPSATGALKPPKKTFTTASSAFVAKLNPAGTALLYVAYLGGSDVDMALAIAVDDAGNAYVTGGTHSRDFPTTSGVLQSAYGGTGGSSLPPSFYPAGDAFVAKLNPAGNALVYSTYLGGTAEDQGYGIGVDAAGSVWVGGATESGTSFPVAAGAFQTRPAGSADAFLAKINPTGTALSYSTLLGGSREDYVFGLALDPSGNVYLTGITTSGDFPVTAGAVQRNHPRPGRPAAFVTRFNAAGPAVAYSTYLGGSVYSEAFAIAADGSGSAYVTGVTNSVDFPVTKGSYTTTNRAPGAQGDVFVTKLSPDGSAFAYSAVMGGNGTDYGMAITTDRDGNAYFAGRTFDYGGTYSSFPTTPDAVQRCGAGDAFVAKLDPSGSNLLYSSHLGGTLLSGAGAIALGADGNVWVAGSTMSPDFPVTAGALQRSHGGTGNDPFDADNLLPYGGDAFVTRTDLSGPVTLRAGCVVNGASFAPGPVSPGAIVSVLGGGLGPEAGAGGTVTNGRVDTTIAGTRVLFDGIPAPLLYARTDQINAVVPYGLKGETAEVQVEVQGQKSNSITVRLAAVSPAIFTMNSSGVGAAAALNQDGSFNSPANPAPAGSIISLFLTGLGETVPAGEDGKLNGVPLPKPVLTVEAYADWLPAEVSYAGAAPGAVAGAFQVNVKIPAQVMGFSETNIMVTLTDAGRFVGAAQNRVTIATR
jgi:uncharacterized protein (TIGR03437 family)